MLLSKSEVMDQLTLMWEACLEQGSCCYEDPFSRNVLTEKEPMAWNFLESCGDRDKPHGKVVPILGGVEKPRELPSNP